MTVWGDPKNMPERSQSLASIMAFLGREIDHSSALLRDLATCLTDVIHTSDEASDARPCLSHAMQALQNEDRIQQRLSDLKNTLLILEHVLQASARPPAVDLDRAIIDQLRLEEMRDAYAECVGLSGHVVRATGDVPAAGDVDLF